METIDREELKKMLDEGRDFTFLNVLSRESYENEHIKGSQNLYFDSDNEQEFLQQVDNITSSKNDPVVVYCAGPDCSASGNAADALEKAGYTNIRAYEGGMEGWKQAAYPVEGKSIAAAKAA